jgi:hypothetical protein
MPKEHIYRGKRRRIIDQSFFIWLFVLLQIAINYFLAETVINRGEQWVLYFVNLMLGAINVPAILLFLKYYKRSVGKEFIVAYDSLRYRDVRTGELVEINTSEVVQVKLVQNVRMSRLPWSFHEYFSIKDVNEKEIVVTSYIMDISELWLDPLARKVDSNKFEREERYYPIF